MQELKRRINKYDQAQKEKLVILGQGPKSYKDILMYLNNEIQMSTKIASFRHQIRCFKNDGVYQLNRAIETVYGVSAAQAESGGPSGGGDKAIETIDVILADGTRIKAPYGKIELPELGEEANIEISYDSSTNELLITGQTEYRFSPMIDDIVVMTRELLNTDSVYKDQAIELDGNCNPTIMDLSNIDKEFMVMSSKTEYDLRPLMTRIEKPEECIAKGIPLKTGVLLEGIYGTGKTLLAFKVAQKAINNGWSFIYLKEPTKLAQTLRLSQTLDNNGHGVIVFLEDVDQVVRGDRNAAMQDILNTLDGGDTKSMNVIAMFTTNHIELIDPTFLRGKRIGSVVSMGPLDHETAMQFITHTFSDYKLGSKGLSKVCDNIATAGIVPAFMAEITETVKANMIYEDSNIIKAEYIQNSLESYLRQVELSKKKENYETDETKLGKALVKVLKADEIVETVEYISDNI
jgi:transitional endoplasmic reticulum ATPase